MAFRLSFASTVPDSLRDCVRAELANATRLLRDEFDDDPIEAVHDARKSLKKARAALRLIRPGLPRRVFASENRALRDAGRLISGARDADVLVETLDGLVRRYADRPAAGELDALRAHLVARSQASPSTTGDGRAQAVAILDGVAVRVEDWPLQGSDWETVAAGMEQAYRAGAIAFAAAQDEPTIERLHDWRKRVKDIWYQQRLTSPAWPAVLDAQAEEAHVLSEILGDDHDLAVLAELLEGDEPQSAPADPGQLLALIAERRDELATDASRLGARLYAERPSAFARRTRRYFENARADAEAQAEAQAQAQAEAEAQAQAQVGAGLEIERKFLVAATPADLGAHPSESIEQGYIAVEDPVEVRLRRRAGRALLTIKSGAGLVRVEQELEIDAGRFDALWPLSEGRRVTKTRHLLPGSDGLTIELDVYSGALDGLVVAEIEFPSPAASRDFEPPPWFGAEVTHDMRYANRALATDGVPPGP